MVCKSWEKTVTTARSELRKVLFLAVFLALSVTFLFVYADLCQIHREGVFGSSLGRVWRSTFGGLHAVYVLKNIFALVFIITLTRKTVACLHKRYLPDGGETICSPPIPFRAFPVIRRYRWPRQMMGSLHACDFLFIFRPSNHGLYLAWSSRYRRRIFSASMCYCITVM